MDLDAAFISPNESDSNGEPANVVDALFYVGRRLKDLGNGDAATSMGAIENLALEVKNAGSRIAESIDGLAQAILLAADGE